VISTIKFLKTEDSTRYDGIYENLKMLRNCNKQTIYLCM